MDDDFSMIKHDTKRWWSFPKLDFDENDVPRSSEDQTRSQEQNSTKSSPCSSEKSFQASAKNFPQKTFESEDSSSDARCQTSQHQWQRINYNDTNNDTETDIRHQSIRLVAGNQPQKLVLPSLGQDKLLERKLIRLIESGSLRAISALGRIYFSEKKFAKALTVLKRCPYWDMQAHYRIGIIYFDGLDTKKDMKRGVKHMRKVAMFSEEDSVPEALIRSAQYFMGYAYYAGLGVITNEDEAIKWWLLAANEGKPSGSVLAQTALGLYYSDPWHFDVDKTARWHMLADKNNSPSSKAPYAVLCMSGLGTEKNPMKALGLLKNAAAVKSDVYAAGNLIAFYYHRKMFNLAALVADRVVSDALFSQDEDTIKSKADRKGLAITSFYLGRCYQLGRGVEQHLPTANYLYRKAIKLDYGIMFKLYQDMIQLIV